jgi:hypothetical protein
MLFQITQTKTRISQTAVSFQETIPYVSQAPAKIMVHADNNLLGESIHTIKLKHRKIINRQ